MIATTSFMGALSMFISCTTLINESHQSLPVDYSKIEVGKWQLPFCQKYGSEFKSLYFHKIAETEPHLVGPEINPTGKLTIGDIRSGRVELNWISNTNTKITIWLKVLVMQEVWVFKNAKAPEGAIGSEDVQRELVDVAPFFGNKKIGLESPIGKAAVKQIRKGEVFTEGMLASLPQIKRNERVMVTATSGSLKIVSPGLALATGWSIGDHISVKIENATGSINAKITGKNNVLVEI